MLRKLGLGLDANAKYQRAFEKGILLGDSATAIRLFQEAAKEFEKRGDADGQYQALANARLYEYIQSGSPEILPSLTEFLARLSEIECIGSATEMMSAATLLAELQARMAEIEVERIERGASHETLAAAHEHARGRFEPIVSEKLVTYPYVVKDQFSESAQSRYFLHAGKACWHRAQAKVNVDPGAAAEEMSQAVMYYRRAGYEQGEQAASRTLANLRLNRTCWVCGREMQGQGINFEYLPTTVSPYHLDLLEKTNQDRTSLDLEHSQVALCVVCKGLITTQAQTIATQIAAQKLRSVEEQLSKLTQRVRKLEDAAQRQGSHPEPKRN